MAAKKRPKKKAPFTKGQTQGGISLSNPYQNVPVQSNGFNFPGAV